MPRCHCLMVSARCLVAGTQVKRKLCFTVEILSGTIGNKVCFPNISLSKFVPVLRLSICHPLFFRLHWSFRYCIYSSLPCAQRAPLAYPIRIRNQQIKLPTFHFLGNQIEQLLVREFSTTNARGSPSAVFTKTKVSGFDRSDTSYVPSMNTSEFAFRKLRTFSQKW